MIQCPTIPLRGASAETDEAKAVEELRRAIHQDSPTLVLFFCSPRFDPGRLGAALKDAFDCPLAGCTTAGEMTTGGYIENTLVGVSFPAPAFKVTSTLIEPLDGFDARRARELESSLGPPPSKGTGRRRFGLLLVDGLSMKEEQTVAHLSAAHGGMRIVGGSAGDGLDFRETRVFGDGRFASNAAVFSVFETEVPFRTFKSQHFRPTETKLVITGADPQRRLVTEIDGFPAAAAYADALGLALEALGPAVFSEHPVILSLAGEQYVRSIQQVTPEGGLVFYCAIEEGLVLTIAEGVDLDLSLDGCLRGLEQDLGSVSLILGCDCILRRLESRQKGLDGKVREILAPRPFVGFSTYGEQYNGIHINQTLTGVAFGRAA